MFYQLLSTIKVKLVDKMMLSGYLSVILHVKRIKLAFIAVLTYFVILCKIQDSDHFLVMSQTSSSATTHKIYLSCREDERLSTKAKSFRNTATYKILWGGVPSNSPPPTPPFTTVGVWIRMYFRGLISFSTKLAITIEIIYTFKFAVRTFHWSNCSPSFPS